MTGKSALIAQGYAVLPIAPAEVSAQKKGYLNINAPAWAVDKFMQIAIWRDDQRKNEPKAAPVLEFLTGVIWPHRHLSL